MPTWLIPAVKAILPLVSPIVSAALPVFTTRKVDDAATAPNSVLQQQIVELQTAASQNAIHVKELAEQLEKTVSALETAAALAEARFRRLVVLCVVACVLAGGAAALALFALLAA
ncbi:MAG: hypothetical protein ACK4UX_05165 [Thiobacillus sp.]